MKTYSLCVCVQWTRCDLVDLPFYSFLHFRCVNGPPKPVNIHLTRPVFIKTHSLTGCVTLSFGFICFYLFSLNLVLFLLSFLHHFLDLFHVLPWHFCYPSPFHFTLDSSAQCRHTDRITEWFSHIFLLHFRGEFTWFCGIDLNMA